MVFSKVFPSSHQTSLRFFDHSKAHILDPEAQWNEGMKKAIYVNLDQSSLSRVGGLTQIFINQPTLKSSQASPGVHSCSQSNSGGTTTHRPSLSMINLHMVYIPATTHPQKLLTLKIISESLPLLYKYIFILWSYLLLFFSE